MVSKQVSPSYCIDHEPHRTPVGTQTLDRFLRSGASTDAYLKMHGPLALEQLIAALEVLFIARLLGEPRVELLEVLAPRVHRALALGARCPQAVELGDQSPLLLLPHLRLWNAS